MASVAILAACGGGDGEEAAAGGSPSGGGSGGNRAPTIGGTPPAQAMQGSSYSFTPSASDPDSGDSLTFSVTGLPPWASFNATTGRITGTPTGADVGMYSNIRISVSDGQASATLGAFSINVVSTATGSATLSWTPPTERTDGSPLTDLAGYKIYWGTNPGAYSNSTTVNNPGLTSYMIDQLTPGTWYFVATAYDSTGIESPFSAPASKTVSQ